MGTVILTSLTTFFGNLFKFGSDLAPSINEWFNKVGIPAAERSDVNIRLRRAKWVLNHYPNIKIVTWVENKFTDQSITMRVNIVELLKEETGRID